MVEVRRGRPGRKGQHPGGAGGWLSAGITVHPGLLSPSCQTPVIGLTSCQGSAQRVLCTMHMQARRYVCAVAGRLSRRGWAASAAGCTPRLSAAGALVAAIVEQPSPLFAATYPEVGQAVFPLDVLAAQLHHAVGVLLVLRGQGTVHRVRKGRRRQPQQSTCCVCICWRGWRCCVAALQAEARDICAPSAGQPGRPGRRGPSGHPRRSANNESIGVRI